jgi:hypothetical protein
VWTEWAGDTSPGDDARPVLANVSTPTPITIETVLDADQVEGFYSLYLKAFGPLRTRAVARQVLHRDEFLAQMSDPRVWKFVAWGRDGHPAGLSTLTRDLSTVPWISPEYFAARFPEETARRAVYYWGFTLTRGPYRHHDRLFLAMLQAVAEVVSAGGGICGYDVCAYNNDTRNFAAQVERISHRLADVTFQVLDTQTYYCATLL